MWCRWSRQAHPLSGCRSTGSSNGSKMFQESLGGPTLSTSFNYENARSENSDDSENLLETDVHHAFKLVHLMSWQLQTIAARQSIATLK